AGADSLVVAYEFKPNKYTKILSAVQGQLSIQVENPSLVSPGSHLLLHQTVGTGGNGTGSGAWELVQAVTVEGTSVIVSKPLTRTYTSCGAACGFAQAVVATSYNQLEVVSGGAIRPSSALGTNGEQYGGIVYVRARKITVKTGGLIEADAAGFLGGDSSQSPAMEKGHSGCSAANDTNFATSPNCGGGGGGGFNGSGYTGGGGGGGNGTAGAAGTGSQPGAGGTQVGSADLATLQFGGGGGGYSHSAGTGGGIVLLGAESVVVETGGIIRANGSAGSGCTSTTHSGAGGGAGGTIAIFASQYVNSGTVQATGGAGGSGPPGNGGNGGTGWVVNKPPVPGIVNESFAKGVQIWVDGVNVTPLVGDPNAKGPPHWDPVSKSWGTTGLAAWSTGPLDLTVVANWTLGEHALEVRETGGSGGDLKLYAYVIYPFSEATAPSHDTCAAPKVLNVMGGAVVTSDTTEDTMGKIKANDDSVQPFCGGSSGPDVVYRMDLTDWRKLTVSVSAPFIPRTYIRKDSCASGQLVACGAASLATDVLKPGTYYLWVDGDGNLQKGNFTLTVTPGLPGPPSNDSCASPAALTFTNGTSSAYGMNLFSSNDYSASCGGGEGLDNVYMFSVPAGTAQLSLSLAAAFQPVLYLGHGACTGPFIACAPSSSYSLGWPEPGTYYVVVDGKTAADKGEYTLTITLQ
ncbi:MAG: hypothetical protein FJ098_04950, partial [Deltaproteobacteria bacterium]|nr:hypothetical protein [Deltaproteobacteria bacterium]